MFAATHRSLSAAVLLFGLLAVPMLASADGGTLSPATPTLNYTSPPFTGANPSINAQDEPDCDLVPNTCHDYDLVVDVDAAYIAANPTYVVTIKATWPPATPANDFDMFVQDPATNTSVQTSASSANPEVVILTPIAGVTNYRVRVLAYAVNNSSFDGAITLGPPPTSDTGEAIYVSSADVFTCNKHLEGQSAVFDHGGDGEPAIKFDADGNAWITGIAGVGGGIGLWKIPAADVCAQSPIFLDNPDAGAGGGDTDIEIASIPNALGFYNIYTSSLSLANITSSTSMDGGVTFVPTPLSTPIPVNDRQWNAAYGQNTLYLSWREGATQPGNTLLVTHSLAAGAPGTFTGPFPVWTDAEVSNPQLTKQLGNMAADQRAGGNEITGMAGANGEGNVYHGFSQNANEIWVAVSRDFGTTWNSTLVYQGSSGESFEHIFTWVAVDHAGNVYTVWSDNHNVFYSASTDIRSSDTPTWSQPTRVNNGPETRTSLLPMIEAGSDGRIIVGWYGSSAPSADDATAQWHYFHARTNNATDAVPVIEQVRVSDHVMHTGQVCQDGLNCACCRELLECQELAVNPTEGSSMVTYGGSGGVYVTRQVAGESAIASLTVPDRSQTCPVPTACGVPPVVEERCILPGITMANDPIGDVAQPPPVGTTQDDIEKISIAEPYLGGPQQLVFTMKVVDLATLPTNRLWTILWNNPDPSDPFPRKFVQMNSCDPTANPSFAYGHVEGNLQTQDGNLPAGDGSYSADGTIVLKIDPALVGSPEPFELLGSVVGEVRLLIGTACSGSIQTLDMATALQPFIYRGNDYCKPHTVTCAADFSGNAGNDYPLSFTVNNPSTAARTFDVQIFDDKNWIVGGPVSTTLGPIPAGSSAALDVILRPAAGCAEGFAKAATVNDLLTWVASASELPAPDSLKHCTTTLMCEEGTGVGDPSTLAFSFRLVGSNPTRGATAVSYALPQPTRVRIDLFNVTGQRVRTLVDGAQPAGVHTLPFEMRNASGRPLGTGVYFARIVTDSESRTVRLVTVR